MKNWHSTLMFVFTLLMAPNNAHSKDTRIIEVFSATDTSAFAQVIAAFETLYPDISVRYHEFNTRELYEKVLRDSSKPDVVISSSMDLQVDLVNRGFAHEFLPEEAKEMPLWSNWLDALYGFTFEPVAMVYNRDAFEPFGLPNSRSELASLIRNEPDVFEGRIGTYDINISGVGYLFATQDTQRGYLFSRLVETFGRAEAKLYCCTSEMIERIGDGELLLGYNILGSYANNAAAKDKRVGIHLFSDYALVMTRTAFIPKSALNKSDAVLFLSFLLSKKGQRAISENSALIPLREDARTDQVKHLLSTSRALIPIRVGPNLLTYLDNMKRERFLNDWHSSLKGRSP